MSMDRRDFLKQSSVGLAAFPGLGLLESFASFHHLPAGKDRIFLLLELAGGNDGLNMVVPHEDPAYHAARPVLGLRRGLHVLGEGLALHPRIGAMARLYKDGDLALVEGVGYPEPNRSHFRSMDIWQSARPDQEKPRLGWLGLAADQLAGKGGNLPAVALGGVELPLCLRARKITIPTLDSLEDYQLARRELARDEVLSKKKLEKSLSSARKSDDRLEALIKAAAREAYLGAEKLRRSAQSYEAKVTYPKTRLGRRFEMASRVVTSPLGTRLLHLRQTGYDTHAGQNRTHGNLLGEMSEALGAFARDMKARGLWDRCLVMVFSEFGRRVAENKSRGTDHGTASTVFLSGGKVKGGLFGKRSSLTKLDRGDLIHTTDFRSVYREVLESWIGVKAVPILKGEYPRIGVI